MLCRFFCRHTLFKRTACKSLHTLPMPKPPYGEPMTQRRYSDSPTHSSPPSHSCPILGLVCSAHTYHMQINILLQVYSKITSRPIPRRGYLWGESTVHTQLQNSYNLIILYRLCVDSENRTYVTGRICTVQYFIFQGENWERRGDFRTPVILGEPFKV